MHCKCSYNDPQLMRCFDAKTKTTGADSVVCVVAWIVVVVVDEWNRLGKANRSRAWVLPIEIYRPQGVNKRRCAYWYREIDFGIHFAKTAPIINLSCLMDWLMQGNVWINRNIYSQTNIVIQLQFFNLSFFVFPLTRIELTWQLAAPLNANEPYSIVGYYFEVELFPM